MIPGTDNSIAPVFPRLVLEFGFKEGDHDAATTPVAAHLGGSRADAGRNLALTPWVLHLVIRRQLESLVANKLDAHLTVGSIEYVYPFGLVLTDAAITTQTPDGKPLELITVPQIEVTLAHSPLGAGPIVVEMLEISDPQVHLVRTASGLAGKPQTGPGSSTSTQPAAPAKLSSVFQIRRLEIRGGQIVYDDQRLTGSIPMVWNQLGVNIRKVADSPSHYSCEIASDDEPRPYLRCTGSLDIDDLLLKVETCALTLAMNPSTDNSPLPANVATMLRSWQTRGIAQIELAGAVPLRNPGAGTYHASLQLRDARALVPGMRLPLDSLAMQLDCSVGTGTGGAHPRLRVQSFEATAGDGRLSLADAVLIADLQKMGWQLSVRKAYLDAGKSRAALPSAVRDSLERLRLTGAADFAIDASGPIQWNAMKESTAHVVMHPRDLTIQPAGFDRPIDGITDAAVTLVNGELLFESLRATYADNLLYVKTAPREYPRSAAASSRSRHRRLSDAGAQWRLPRPIGQVPPRHPSRRALLLRRVDYCRLDRFQAHSGLPPERAYHARTPDARHIAYHAERHRYADLRDARGRDHVET